MKAIFLRLWVWVTGSSVAMFRLLAPILASNASQLLVALEPIAINAVLSAATPGKSGSEKRADAFDAIKAAAIQQGIQAGADVINTSIELTVQALKAKGQL